MDRSKYKLIDGVRYHVHRPWNCKNCFWRKNKKVGWLLGKREADLYPERIRKLIAHKRRTCQFMSYFELSDRRSEPNSLESRLQILQVETY